MPSEALSVRLMGINGASNEIEGGTEEISFLIKYNCVNQSVFAVVPNIQYHSKTGK